MFGIRGDAALRRALAVLSVLALAFGAAACGSDDNGDDGGSGGGGESGASSGQTEEVAAAYEEFAGHIGKHRWKEACAAYTTAYAKAYPKKIKLADTCVDTMKAEFAALPPGSPLPRVTKVESRGPQSATVVVKSRAGGNGTALDLVKVGGEWKIEGPAEQTTRWAR